MIDGKKRVGILEDDVRLANHLASTLEFGGFEIVFVSYTLTDALAELEENKVDICLSDLQLPDGSGLTFISTATALGAKSLVLTVFGDQKSVLAALAAGASGYLLKDTRPEKISEYVAATLNGDAPFSPAAARYLVKAFQAKKDQPVTPKPSTILTNRELDVLTSFAKGLSYAEASQALDISKHTVAEHVKAIYRKLDVHSRNEAIFEATQLGLL